MQRWGRLQHHLTVVFRVSARRHVGSARRDAPRSRSISVMSLYPALSGPFIAVHSQINAKKSGGSGNLYQATIDALWAEARRLSTLPSPQFGPKYVTSEPGTLWGLSPNQRMMLALSRAKAQLPSALYQKFEELFTRTNLLIMGGAVGVLVAAHFFGVGEIIDLIGLAWIGVDSAVTLIDLCGAIADARAAVDDVQIDVAASRIAKDFSELVRTGALTLGGAGSREIGSCRARLLKGKRVTVPEVPPEAPPPPPEVPPPPPEVPPVEPPVEPPPVERTPVPGGDLAVHEAAGGHTIAEHVGRTTEQLATRLVDEPKIPAASTFPNIATAERATADALQARSAEIASWLSTSALRGWY